MTRGLLDLPAPLLDGLDSVLQAVGLPALLRLVLYAVLCALLMMRIYLRCSDQAALAETRAEVARTRRVLAAHEGSFADLNSMIRDNLRSSLRQLGLTLRPALIASLPMLILLPWLSNGFSIDTPAPGDAIEVCVHPAGAAATLAWQPAIAAYSGQSGCWQLRWPGTDMQAQLHDSRGAVLLTLPPAARSDIVHKFTLYNWVIGNPGGYLPDDARLDSVSIALPARELVHFGPAWLRGWEFWFLGAAFLASLAFKLRWRVI